MHEFFALLHACRCQFSSCTRSAADEMRVNVNGEERDVIPVFDQSGFHAIGEGGGLLYETECE